MQNNMTRRDFMKIAGIGTGALVASTSFFNTAFASSTRVDIQGLFSAQKLNNGVEMPVFGFGAYSQTFGKDDKNHVDVVLEALKLGYKHIGVYETQEIVGEALIKSEIPRNEVFISTHVGRDVKNADEAIVDFNEKLAKLKTDYVDLLSVSFSKPHEFDDSVLKRNVDVWQAMQQLYKDKRVRAIGVSFLSPVYFYPFLEECEVKPAVNSLGFNPYLFNDRLIELCDNRKIAIATFNPLAGKKELLYEPSLIKVAQKHNKTPAQIVLRWSLQRGFTTLPSTTDISLVQEYSKIFDFALDQRDMKAVSKLKKDMKPAKNTANSNKK